MSFTPIKLGSAFNGGLIFQSGSKVTTNDAGIDEAQIKVLYGGGALPSLTKGTPYSAIFGNGYLPDSFLLDTGEVDFLDGLVLGGTITFKRQNPLLTGRTKAKIYTDSAINYDSPFLQTVLTVIAGNSSAGVGGSVGTGKFGFPEPVVTVKYNDSTQPSITGNITSLYATPGSAAAQGFPSVADITVPYSVPAGVGAYVSYFNGSAIVSKGPLVANTLLTFNLVFRANPLGWQLQRVKSDPISGPAFYDIEQEWKMSFFYASSNLVSAVPPLP